MGAIAPALQRWPGKQGLHSAGLIRLEALEKDPAGHSCATLLAVGQKAPAPHFMHAVAPELGCSEPAAQGVHADCPAFEVELPGTHLAATTAPGPDQLPGGASSHSLWADSPVRFEKVPALHGVGTALPFGQKWPSGHSCAAVVLLDRHSFPAGQSPLQRESLWCIGSLEPSTPAEHAYGKLPRLPNGST